MYTFFLFCTLGLTDVTSSKPLARRIPKLGDQAFGASARDSLLTKINETVRDISSTLGDDVGQGDATSTKPLARRIPKHHNQATQTDALLRQDADDGDGDGDKPDKVDSVRALTNEQATTQTGVCVNGDIKLINGMHPWIYYGSTWYPVCGHWFWDNEYGAQIVCKKLGLSGGTQTRDESKTFGRDALLVGKCNAGDTSLTSCTGGSNHYWAVQTSGGCSAGQGVGVKVTCSGQVPTPVTSCQIQAPTQAYTGSVTCDSTSAGSPSANSIVDGDTNTFWTSGYEQNSYACTFDLGALKQVTESVIHYHLGDGDEGQRRTCASWNLAYSSDGSSWTSPTAWSFTGQTQARTQDSISVTGPVTQSGFTSVAARYLRWQCTGGSRNSVDVKISEWNVNGPQQAECKQWCKGNTSPWSTKCGWPNCNACLGCF